ncbi:MAG: hypothetical protein IPJ82_21190 [Lewinellaceae bacterium]|nr:hypothetical protein [Lewinellaceae bacterium]
MYKASARVIVWCWVSYYAKWKAPGPSTALAQEIISRLLATGTRPAESLRIASHWRSGLGKYLYRSARHVPDRARSARVAVLAIDPGSALSKGDILGDKTRMERLSVSEQAFIRPSLPANRWAAWPAKHARPSSWQAADLQHRDYRKRWAWGDRRSRRTA